MSAAYCGRVQPVIATARLLLQTLTVDDLDHLIAGVDTIHAAVLPAGWPHDDGDELAMLQFFADRIRTAPELAEWRIRTIVHAGKLVGHIGFHDAPDYGTVDGTVDGTLDGTDHRTTDGMLELGYTVFAPFRRQGFASEAILGLISAAISDHGVRRFRLAISPDNEPSLALADSLGFALVGEQIDPDDGLELLYERTWPG